MRELLVDEIEVQDAKNDGDDVVEKEQQASSESVSVDDGLNGVKVREFFDCLIKGLDALIPGHLSF